jgi:glycosylphosphatidylinositol transamidase (GPIT) subunit GPI8
MRIEERNLNINDVYLQFFINFHDAITIYMNKLILSLIFLSCAFRSASSQKAFLLTTSVGFYNYRQLSNVLEVYHILKKHGF